MTNARVQRSTDRAELEDKALAQIAGRAPRSPARRLGWLEAVGVVLWLCVLMMITLVGISALA